MKSFITALCIAAIMVLGSLLYTTHMEHVSQELINGNRVITELVEQEEYKAAGQVLKQIREYMDERKTLLAATGNHEELDQIEVYMAELEQYISGKQQTDALAKCSVLRHLFEHLPRNYKLRAENIL